MTAESLLRIATRNSPLAMWQAHHVADLLQRHDPDLQIEFVDTATFADKRLDLPISELGGKGAFSKEIQDLVLSGSADLAVHSAKDLQATTPDGLVIGAFPERGNACDVLVGARLADLADGATVGTGSNRRRVQLAHLRPALAFAGLRGNIATRLSKSGDFDAIVMAAAALDRLDVDLPVVDVLPPDVMIPQVGQGALAVECLDGATEVLERLDAIDHRETRALVTAERGFLIELGGDCDLPAGAHARKDGDQMTLMAVLASPDESVLSRVEVVGEFDQSKPGELGASAARDLQNRLESNA